MTRIVLELPHEKDLSLLLVLLERLSIRVVEKSSLKNRAKPVESDTAFILKGLPTRHDFEEFVADFEMFSERKAGIQPECRGNSVEVIRQFGSR